MTNIYLKFTNDQRAILGSRQISLGRLNQPLLAMASLDIKFLEME
jgi:hypothetical protein